MGYNYVPRLSSVGLLTLPYYNELPNPFTPLRTRYYNTGHGECTTYAYGRWLEIAGGDITKLSGLLETRSRTGGTWNGGAWYMASNPSVRAGQSNPQPGDIICLKKSGDTWDGHVGVVEEVHPDYIVCSESEHSDDLFQLVTRRASLAYTGNNPGNYYQKNHYKLQGFLRMQGIPSQPTIPDFDMPTEWVYYPHYYDMTDADKENNAIMIAVILNSYGWTFDAIIGVLGNLEAESNLDPQAEGTGGCGLAGWTPPSIYRIWSNYYGYTWYDGDKQVEFLSMNAYVDPGDPYNSDGTPKLKPQWQARPSLGINISFDEYTQWYGAPEDMARYWMLCWERPLDQSAAAQAARGARARKWYDFLLGMNFEDSKRPYIHKMPIWMMAGNAKPKLIY